MSVTQRMFIFGFMLAIFISMSNGLWLRGVNGGSDCASCTIVLGVVEHLSILYNESIVSSLERFCNYLPTQFRVYCKEAVEFLGKTIYEPMNYNEFH